MWPEESQITALLRRHKTGDSGALEQIVPLLYDELRRVARQHMRHEYRKGHTLSATALVSEAYLKLARLEGPDAVSSTTPGPKNGSNEATDSYCCPSTKKPFGRLSRRSLSFLLILRRLLIKQWSCGLLMLRVSS
jgi:hypothetical protein